MASRLYTIVTKLTPSLAYLLFPEQIQYDLESYISDMASLAQLNVWNWTPFQAVYTNRDNPTTVDPWAVSGLITYANGSMNDDGKVVKATIIHFLGVRTLPLDHRFDT